MASLVVMCTSHCETVCLLIVRIISLLHYDGDMVCIVHTVCVYVVLCMCHSMCVLLCIEFIPAIQI